MPNPHHPFRFSRAGLLGLKPSATLTMNDRIRAMMAGGREIFHLGFGESRFPVHPRIAAAVVENVNQRSYLPALGIAPLRQAIASFYGSRLGFSIEAEQVVIGPGSKSLLYALMIALDGDILLPTPAWVTYGSQAQLTGRPVLEVAMDPAKDYRLDVGRLREAAEKAASQWRNPDLLLLTTPHNPTGRVLSEEELAEVTRFAREREMMILSDEIYSLVTHGGITHLSPANEYREGTVILGGLSKHMSLGGWRFGMAILPPGEAGQAIARAIQAIAGSTWSCVAAPVQYAALAAYGDHPEINEYIAQCAGIHELRTRAVYEALIEFGVSCPEPQGAFYLYPSFNKWKEPLAARGVRTCQELSYYLLDNHEIATLPGVSFGDVPGALSLRLSTSFLDAETDEQAENSLSAFKASGSGDQFIEAHQPRLRKMINRFADFATEMEGDLS